MTASPQTSPGVRVAAVFVSGLAINGLSDSLRLTAPVVLGLALVALLLLLAAESAHTSVSLPAVLNPELLKFVLASLLLGAGIGASSIIPIWQSRRIYLPQGGYVHNYEIGAAAALISLAVIAASRRQRLTRWLTYIAASLAGMTLSVTYGKPLENDALTTFVSWFIIATVITLTLSQLPELGRLFRDFLLGRDNQTGPVP